MSLVNILCPECNEIEVPEQWDKATNKVFGNNPGESIRPIIESIGNPDYWFICPSCGEQCDGSKLSIIEMAEQYSYTVTEVVHTKVQYSITLRAASSEEASYKAQDEIAKIISKLQSLAPELWDGDLEIELEDSGYTDIECNDCPEEETLDD